jgi:hypothetical protein
MSSAPSLGEDLQLRGVDHDIQHFQVFAGLNAH